MRSHIEEASLQSQRDLVDQFLRESATSQQRRRRRTRAALVTVLAVVTTLGAVASWFAYRMYQERDTAVIAQATAEAESTRAHAAEQGESTRAAQAVAEADARATAVVLTERQRAIARSRELAARAEGIVGKDPQLGILLGLEAVYETQESTPGSMTREACSVLYSAVAMRSRWQATLLIRHAGPLFHATWDQAGERIVTANDDGTAMVWDGATGELLLTLGGHSDAVRHAAWDPAGQRIVTASNDDTAMVWDAATGEALLSLAAHSDGVNHAAWDPTGERIVTASHDDTVIVWYAATGEALLHLAGHGAAVRHVAWDPAGERILTVSYGESARIWYPRPDALTELARSRTGRNMTRQEWHQYMGSDIRYRKTCPDLPIPHEAWR